MFWDFLLSKKQVVQNINFRMEIFKKERILIVALQVPSVRLVRLPSEYYFSLEVSLKKFLKIFWPNLMSWGSSTALELSSIWNKRFMTKSGTKTINREISGRYRSLWAFLIHSNNSAAHFPVPYEIWIIFVKSSKKSRLKFSNMASLKAMLNNFGQGPKFRVTKFLNKKSSKNLLKLPRWRVVTV